MKFNAFFHRSALAAVLWPLAAVAQAPAGGEPADGGAAADPGAVAAVRSALWLAVEAHHRQGDAAPQPPDRRLSSAELQELREQVRRAWDRPAALPATAESSAQR